MLAPSAARCVVQKRKPLASAVQLLADKFLSTPRENYTERSPAFPDKSYCLVLGRNGNRKIMSQKLFMELPGIPPTPTKESSS